MLKDRYFYPLAIALIAAMIWFALSKGTHDILTTKNILENGYVIDKENLSKLIASPGTSYDFVAKAQGNSQSYVTLKSSIALNNIPTSAGVFAPLGPELEKAFAERHLRITVRARQGQNTPLTNFYIAYFTADVGDSGWQRKTLTPAWQNYVIEFNPKATVNKLGVDYLGILPGKTGNQKTIDVQFIKIDIIPKLK